MVSAAINVGKGEFVRVEGVASLVEAIKHAFGEDAQKIARYNSDREVRRQKPPYFGVHEHSGIIYNSAGKIVGYVTETW